MAAAAPRRHRRRSEFESPKEAQNYERALRIFTALLQSHRLGHGGLLPLVGTALHNMGVVHLRAECHNDALDCLERAVRVRNGAIGQDHPDVSAAAASAPPAAAAAGCAAADFALLGAPSHLRRAAGPPLEETETA